MGVGDVTLRSVSWMVPPTAGRLGAVLPVVESLDEAGYLRVDVWGDISLAHCLGQLNESPWERLRALCARVSRSTPQMQLAGTCLVGSTPRPLRVLREFIERAADCGVRSFLVYDPLNSPAVLEDALVSCRKAGVECRLGLVYGGRVTGAVDQIQELARRMAVAGPDGLCLKTTKALGPRSARSIVGILKESVPAVPLEVDLDNAGGMGPLAATCCAEAGADLVYTSVAPAWLDPAALPVCALLASLEDMGMESGLRPPVVAEAAQRFASLSDPRDRSVVNQLEVARHWPEAREVPAGVLYRLALRLGEQGALGRLREALEEFIRVCSDMGADGLAAPLADIAGTQAILNVIYGRRWHVVPDEMRAYLRGVYGSSPSPVAHDVLLAVFGESPVSPEMVVGAQAAEPPRAQGLSERGGPRDVGTESWEEDGDVARAGEDRYAETLLLDGMTAEEVLLLKLAPQEATAFLARRKALTDVAGYHSTSKSEGDLLPAVDAWERFGPSELRELVAILESSDVEELTVETAGAKVSLRKAGSAGSSRSGSPPAEPTRAWPGERAAEVAGKLPGEGEHVVTAPMVGTFYRGPAPEAPPFVVQGQRVLAGDPLCVLEAMKLLNEVVADVPGVIGAILVEDGAPVEYGQPLFVIETDRE